MRRCLWMLLGCLVAPPGSASAAEHWVVAVDRWGSLEYRSLLLERRGDALSGTLGGDPLRVRDEGEAVAFDATDDRGATYRYRVRIDGDVLSGQADFPDPNDPARRVRHGVAGRRVPARDTERPQRHEYVPTDYANAFDPHREPVLTIHPGDTVRTRTLDSGGVDADGVTRALFGNPQTGPFFVAGAEPGDTLAVRILRLRPNRAYADSLDALVGRALAPSLVADAASLGQPRRWTLDLARNVARPEPSGGRLDGLEIPLRPMLGGIGVAPGFGFPPLSSGDSGRFGGNMDFNAVIEGSIVYLPVFQPGALLYLGDAHAAQGDGETTQFALETSMDVEFAVDVLKGVRIAAPRIESPTHLMTLGQAGSLDEALKAATAGLVQWLRQDYGVDLSEAAQLLGAGVEYRVATLAGRNAGMVAKLPKSMLAGLPRTSAPPAHDAR